MEPFASLSRPATEIRPPLSDNTVAQRFSAQRPEAPAIVHVTIDRIDVRMPAAAQASQQPTPKPRAASAVALGDYLRQRDRARNGGAT